MAELNFDTGLVTYSINGKCNVSFNPTDSNFVGRLHAAFESLDKLQEDLKGKYSEIDDNRKVFDFAKEADTEMRNIIDGVFEKSVCSDLFGDMNVYAIASGLPVWCNFMLAVMDEIDGKYESEQKLTNQRVERYVAKYRKYQKH